jgi:HSP20 family protein
MANIIRRYPGQEVAQSSGAWDPFRAVRDVFRWDPFREIEAALGAEYRGVSSFAPTFDVKETKEAYVFRADLPGVKEEDLEISLTGNRLAISGHREQESREQGETYYATERSYGAFSRAFTLPEGVDGENVRAELKNGVLHVNVPKKPEVQPRRISVGSGAEGKAKA